MDMIKFFFNEKAVMALVIIRRHRGDVYGRTVTKGIDTTYGHTLEILKKLEKQKMIISEKSGRKKFVKLTKKGERSADLFIELIEELDLDYLD